MEFMKVMCTVMMFMNAFQPCRCIVKPCPLFKDHVILTAKRDNPIVKFSFSPYDSPSCVKPDAEIMSLEVSGISTSAAFANTFCQWFPRTTGTAHSAQNRSQNCTYNAYQRHFTLLLPVNGTEDQRWKVECRVKQSPSDEEVRLVGKLTIRMEEN
ncbi:uncharacterized protein LOC143291537 [Babylonia areolata]|uniref:uncharacterized protein LOC143291537 n=1 Tax=Babylonia areolata TaxID=304850 RepID=UPI003FD42EC8